MLLLVQGHFLAPAHSPMGASFLLTHSFLVLCDTHCPDHDSPASLLCLLYVLMTLKGSLTSSSPPSIIIQATPSPMTHGLTPDSYPEPQASTSS